jgi:hypothetical protein
MTATASLAVAQGNEYLQGWAANERPAHLQEPCWISDGVLCHGMSCFVILSETLLILQV